MREVFQMLGFGLLWLITVMTGSLIGGGLYWHVLKPIFLRVEN